MFDVNNEEIEFSQIDLENLELDINQATFANSPTVKEYCVPIFVQSNNISNGDFVGNGLIVGDKLITAAHVIKQRTSVFKFGNEFFSITNDNLIYIEDSGFDSEQQVYKDLAIIRLEEKKNDICLNRDDIVEESVVFISPYDYSHKAQQQLNRFCTKGRVITKNYLSVETNMVWKNCIRMFFVGGLRAGNSGSAVYKDDIVYGFLLKGVDGRCDSYCILDAKYIAEILENIENEW